MKPELQNCYPTSFATSGKEKRGGKKKPNHKNHSKQLSDHNSSHISLWFTATKNFAKKCSSYPSKDTAMGQ